MYSVIHRCTVISSNSDLTWCQIDRLQVKQNAPLQRNSFLFISTFVFHYSDTIIPDSNQNWKKSQWIKKHKEMESFVYQVKETLNYIP